MAGAACIVLAILLGGTDLLIKRHMELRELPADGKKPVLGGRIILRRSRNRGAAFHIGERKSALVAALSVFLTIGTAVCLIVTLGQRQSPLLAAGLTLLLGGAFSNTYDRLKRKYVLDYFSFGVRWRWLQNIVFNLADFCIIIGALLAALGGAR